MKHNDKSILTLHKAELDTLILALTELYLEALSLNHGPSEAKCRDVLKDALKLRAEIDFQLANCE